MKLPLLSGCHLSFSTSTRRLKMNPAQSLTNVCLLFLVAILGVQSATRSATEDEQSHSICPLTSELRLSANSDNLTHLHAEANVFFTLLLPQLDCQSEWLEQRDTLIYLNAVSYALDLLNAEPNTDSHSIRQYLPRLQPLPSWPGPIKYGAKVVTVPRTEMTDSSSLHMECLPHRSSSYIHDLALLDAAHLFHKESVSELMEQIPIISLSSKESILTTSFRANLIVNLLDTVDWKHFAIITTRHEDSLYIVKILGQIAHSGRVCISNIFEWSSKHSVMHVSSESEESVNDELTVQERLGHFLRSIHRAKTKIPILVVSNDEEHVSQLVQILYQSFSSQISSHQLFFSLVPSPELLSRLQLLSRWSTVFTLTSQLPDIPDYHSTMQFKPKECNSVDASDSIATSEMWRKWLSFLPIRSMFSVAVALNQAFIKLCIDKRANNASQPWCSQLAELDRKAFINYLNEMEDKTEYNWMSLGTIDHWGQFSELLLYNGDEFRVMKSNYSFEASNCHNSECSSCIKFRQSRNDDPNQDEVGPIGDMFGHGGHNDLHILLKEEESSAPVEEEEDNSMLHVETHEIYMGLLLPLHQGGASILECSSELNLPAYYIYEAARWIIDKINQNNYLIPGIEIKLELIDTCSSPYYATQELAHLTSSEAKVQPIAFVSSLPRDHYKQVVDFVSAINYTLIATQDISFMDLKFGPRFGILQTAATSHNLVRSLVEQLKYFGWRYVSVVVDSNDLISMSMLHYLTELTSNEKICFASIEQLADHSPNETMFRLMDNYKNGANVAILLTNFASTANLMAYYQSGIKLGYVRNENLHFIAVRDQNLEMVHGFEEEYLGSIFIRESIGKMNHFDNHFLDLLANPKKEQLLYKFISQCGSNSAQCLRLINSFDRTVAANTMQAILAIVGGFARMRNETCASEQGICNKMLETNFHKNLLTYILNTRSMRIDSQSDRRFKSDNYDIFEFNQDGSSGRDIEVLNFKHDFSNGLFRFDTVALYQHDGKTLVRNQNVRYIFYKYNGLVNGHKEYNETELITSDCANLQKCTQCEPQTPEFIYMPSWDNLLLTGVFDVHMHSLQNPLICQRNNTSVESVQNVEAFLWTIDLVNNDPNILPGVHLGALIFDTCSSYQKIYRDISNFLSNSLLLGENSIQMPTAESVVGFVVDGKNTKILDSILDLTNPLKLSVLSTEAKETKYDNMKHYSQFLGFSLPNSLHVDAILKMLHNYSWDFISVLYENNLVQQQYTDAFEYFSSKATNFGIRLAAKELFDQNNVHANIEQLKVAAQMGSKVVVLFLSPGNLLTFMQANSLLVDEHHKLLPHEAVYICVDCEAALHNLGPLSLSVISVSQQRKVVAEFNEHFLDLSLQTNVKNPWFTKLWEKVYSCEGFGCYRTSGSLRQRNVTVNERTTQTINSVYALAHSLELVRQNLCPNVYSGLCKNFVSNLRQVSRLEHDLIKENEFTGLDGVKVKFGPESNYVTGHLNLFNLQKLDRNESRWVHVGQFDLENGLFVASDKTKAYTADGRNVNFTQIVSHCLSARKCAQPVNGSNSLLLPPLMGSSEEMQASVALVVPLHTTDNHSKCGPINSDAFEKLMAFYYALDQHNQVSPVQLGVIVLDSCVYSKQQVQQLASLQNYRLLPKIVSIINLLEANHLNLSLSNQLFNMISDYSPFVYNLYRAKSEEQQSLFFNEKTNANENANQVLRSIVDFCARAKWPVVNLVYSNEFSKNYFLFEANQNNICVDKTLSVTLKDIAKPQFKDNWNQFIKSLDTQIIIVLTSGDIAEYLIKYSDKLALEKSVWIGDKGLKSGSINAQKNLRKNIQRQIILKKLNRDHSLDLIPVSSMIDKLSKYFDVNSGQTRNKVVTGWLYEYWHRKFNCLLNAKKQDCFEVKNARKALVNTKELKHIIDFGQVLASSVANFVHQKCNSTTTSSQMDDSCIYNFHVRNELKNRIIDDLNRNNYLNDIRKVNADSNYEVEVVTNFGKTLNIFNSLNWLNVSSLVSQAGSPVSGACKSSCDSCRAQLSQNRNKTNHLLFADSLQSPLTGNISLHRSWAIAVSILSTLGLIVVLICVLYFILIFPVALGTTIIGYQILVGLFFCYLINFAYLLPSTASLCWVREYGLSIAYSVILGGLFVKVYNFWCQALMKKSTKPLAYNSPMTLLSISFLFVVVQVSITALLTYKYPSNYGLFANTLQCSASTKFSLLRVETAMSLLLLAVLFVVTLFFALKTLDNLESRWILVCSALSVLTWLCWLVYDSFRAESKSISIVMANLVNSTIFIVLLYIRKLYLFSKISRKILKERRVNMDANMQYEPFADYQQQYGAFRACTENISWSNIQDKANYRTATRSPFEADNEDNVSSCGSVKSNSSSQVQCQELYPMEVYDNQLSSQQAATSARVGQSTRSVYDIIDDANFK